MKKPIVIGLVAAFILGVGAYGGIHYWTQRQAHAVIEDALAHVRATGARASVGSSAVSLRDRSLTLGDLRVTSADGSVSLAVATLDARGLGEPRDGRITAESVVLDGVTLTHTDGAGGGRIVETLPHVAIANYSGPLVVTPTGGAIAGLAEASPVVLALRQFAEAEAARIEVPQAIVRFTPAPERPGQPRELTFDDVVLTDARAGRIGLLSVARFATQGLPDPRGAAPAGAGEHGEEAATGLPRADVMAIVVRDIDLAPLTATAGGDTLHQVIGGLQTGVFHFEQDDDIRTEGASLSLTALALKPAVLTPEGFAALNALSADEPPADPAPLLAQAGALLKGIGFAAFQARDLRTVEPAGSGRAALFALNTLNDGKIAEILFEGLSGDSDGRSVKFGRFAIAGADLPLLLALSHASDPTAPEVATGGFRALSGITADAVEVPTEGEDGNPDTPIRIGHAGLTWSDIGGDAPGALPTRIRFDLSDVTGPIDAEDGEPFATLAAAGLKKATFSLALGARYDAATRSIILSPADMKVKDAFGMAVAARLDNVPASAFAAQAAFAEALPGVEIGPVSLTITDNGMADLVLQRLAEAEGMSVADYRAHLLDLLNQGIAAAAPNAPEAAAVGEAVARFISDPKTLVLTAVPRGRVPLIALITAQDPMEPLQLFSFSAVNKP